MPSDTDRLAVAPTASHDTVERIVRALHVVVAVAAVLALVAVAPGLDRLLAAAGLGVADVLVAVVAAVAAGALVRVAPSLEALVSQALDGPDAVVSDLGVATRALAWFGAVVVAHAGLAPVVVAVAGGDAALAVDVGFLVAAVVPLAVIARRLWATRDPLADLLARELVGDGAGPGRAGPTDAVED